MMARATPQVGYDIPSTRVAVPSDVPDVIIQSLAAMATARLSPARVAVDVASVVLVGLSVLFVYLYGVPYRRGFFCDDESIRYPAHEDTVSSLALVIGALGIPIILVCGMEMVQSGWASPSAVTLGGRAVPLWAHDAGRCSLAFLWGAGAQQLVVDVGKIVVGRLRPNFLDVCQPDFDCSQNETPFSYVSTYKCLASDQDAVDEARVSFPSGHSALSFFGAIFIIMYLQRTTTSCRWSLPLNLVQLLALLAAWFTALSRISDYKHHWSDVLAGIFIGTTAAILTSLFVQRRRMAASSEDMDSPLTGSQPSSYGPVDIKTVI